LNLTHLLFSKFAGIADGFLTLVVVFVGTLYLMGWAVSYAKKQSEDNDEKRMWWKIVGFLLASTLISLLLIMLGNLILIQ
jgi:hypothetical protein